MVSLYMNVTHQEETMICKFVTFLFLKAYLEIQFFAKSVQFNL